MSVYNKVGNVHSPDAKYTGEEPNFYGWEQWPLEKFYSERSRALRFYGYYLSEKDLKPIVLAWMKKEGYSKERISVIKEASPNVIPSTVGKLIRCMDRGMPVMHPKAQEYYNTLPFHETPPIAKSDYDLVKSEIIAVVQLINRLDAEAVSETNLTIVAPKVKPISPIDRIRESVRKDIIVVLDELVDQWGNTSLANITTVNMANLLRDHKVPAIGCKQIIDWLEQHRVEYNDAFEKTCEQAVEGYNYLSKVDLRKIVKCFDTMLYDVRIHSKVKMSARKPRVKKTKDATKQVLRIKYQHNSADYNIDSIAPMRIPGSQRLYVFNTKYRQIAVYNAKGSAGFEVKGSSLHGWDPGTSFSMTLRKPTETLLSILSATPKKLDGILDGIKSVKKKASGRFNDQCVLLKVIENRL